MRSRKLDEKIEALRSEMEKRAMDLGFTHPQVYRLSLQLDRLHNQWLQHAFTEISTENLAWIETSC